MSADARPDETCPGGHLSGDRHRPSSTSGNCTLTDLAISTNLSKEFKKLNSPPLSCLSTRTNGSIAAQGDLETTDGRETIEGFLGTNFAGQIKGPPKILRGQDHSFSDVAKKVDQNGEVQ